MEVLLLGTGGPRGCPRPACGCATCAALRAAGTWRAPTAVLVDGTLLLGDEIHSGGSAARAGRSLGGVGRRVALPGSALASGPDPVVWPSAPAEAHTVDEPAAGVFVVRRPTGVLLLVAGRLAGGVAEAAVAASGGTAYDVVLLALPFDGAVATLAALRARGAATAHTRAALVGLDHDTPPPAELDRRAAAWGVEVHPDGTVLGTVPPTPTPPPRRTLVLGGARSGKSREAERRLAGEPRVRYVATAGTREDDAEWAERVAAHRERRPPGWQTLETTDPARVLRAPGPPVLLDCLALWLTAVLDGAQAWTRGRESLGEVHRRVDELLDAWTGTPATAVAVSNEVGSGVVPATTAGRLFRDELGRLNALMGERSDEVLLVVAGHALRLR